MKEMAAMDLQGPVLEFMVHMADVAVSEDRMTGMTAGWGVHFDRVHILRAGKPVTLLSRGVSSDVSFKRGHVAATLGDSVSVPDILED